jgi:hypothetical protein
MIAAGEEIKTVTTHASIVGYRDEQELYDAADLIVLGTVSTLLHEDESETGDIPGGFVTYTPFYVDMVLKGSSNASTIDVTQPAVITLNSDGLLIKRTFEGYEELRIGDTYILYLEYREDLSEERGRPTYNQLGIYNGQFSITDDIDAIIDTEVYLNKPYEWYGIRHEVIMRFGEQVMGTEFFEKYDAIFSNYTNDRMDLYGYPP